MNTKHSSRSPTKLLFPPKTCKFFLKKMCSFYNILNDTEIKYIDLIHDP